jgi:hypothetical protein
MGAFHFLKILSLREAYTERSCRVAIVRFSTKNKSMRLLLRSSTLRAIAPAPATVKVVITELRSRWGIKILNPEQTASKMNGSQRVKIF